MFARGRQSCRAILGGLPCRVARVTWGIFTMVICKRSGRASGPHQGRTGAVPADNNDHHGSPEVSTGFDTLTNGFEA